MIFKGHSKTQWFNLLIALLPFFPWLDAIVPLVKQPEVILPAVGLANMALRKVTKSPLKKGILNPMSWFTKEE